jgi:CRP-like cAMP-binding protein
MHSQKNAILDKMQHNSLFSTMPPADVETLATSAINRHYHQGQVIADAGDEWPYLILIGAGVVSAVKISYEGRRLLITSLGRDEVFWGLGFFSDQTQMPVSLEATETCQIFLWSRDTLVPVLLKNPQSMWCLCQLMVMRMARASEVLDEQVFQSNAGRLARLLLDSFRSADGACVARSLSLDEMADRIGTTREIVCRLLYQFSDRDLIQVTRTEFSLKDGDGLRELANL